MRIKYTFFRTGLMFRPARNGVPPVTSVMSLSVAALCLYCSMLIYCIVFALSYNDLTQCSSAFRSWDMTLQGPFE